MAERSTRTGTTAGVTSAGASVQADTLAAEAKQTAHSASDVIRAGKDQAVDEAKAMVQDMADRQRRRAAENLGGMAQALHKSARDIEQENRTMARYTEIAASRLDEVAGYLRQADWHEILHGAENFARRQPYWFVGGAAAAGFFLARFLKSSGGTASSATTTREGLGTSGRSGSAYAPGIAPAAGYGTSTASSPYTSPSSGASTTPSGDLT